MHRHRCSVFIGALAVAVSTVVAGPAFAAKGGNSDNAHACQQGGHENLFHSETGNPFKNTGDCASHAGSGDAVTPLQIANSPTYSCGSASCWGVISASGGLNEQSNSSWTVTATEGPFSASGPVNPDGSITATKLNIPCGGGGPPTIIGTAHLPDGTPTSVTVQAEADCLLGPG